MAVKKQAEIPDGKIIDFIDGKTRADTEVEQIRQNFERTLIEEYRFEKADVEPDFRIKVPDGTRVVQRKMPLVVFRSGVNEKTQDDIYILIHITKPATQPSDSASGANELERGL